MEAGGGGTFAFAESRTAYDDADRADPTILYNPVVGPPGPNASGRTTTTRTLTTRPPPDAGRIPLGGSANLVVLGRPTGMPRADVRNLTLKNNDIGRHTWEAFIAERSAA